MKLPSPEICERLFQVHARLGESHGADFLDDLLKLLIENDVSWSDFPEMWAHAGRTSSRFDRLKSTDAKKTEELCRSVNGLHEMIGRASTSDQQRKARNALIKKLAEAEVSFNWKDDLPGILAAKWRDENSANPANASTNTAGSSASVSDVNLFDLVSAVIEDRVVLSWAENTVAAAWALYTYKYDDFLYAPQLGIVAPASGHGKSVLRKVLEAIVHNPWHSHGPSPAVIYRMLERNPRTTLMLEEGENQNFHNSDLLKIIDACYEYDGSRDLVDKEGNPLKFHVFAPVLWALRGSISDVPMSMLSRAFIIAMRRGTPRIRLQKDYFNDPDLVAVRALSADWDANTQLDPNPEIPPELSPDPRLADDCRPLIAVCDSLKRGAEVRAALIELCEGVPNSDVGLQLLEDCKKVWLLKDEHLFTLGDVDRISKKALLAGVIEQNPFWESWRGRNDKGQPHQLTTAELSGLSRRFKIFTKTIWPVPRVPESKSVPGYTLDQFEKAWAQYCTEEDTSTQTSKVIRLPRH